MDIFELERNMISFKDWKKLVPEHIYNEYLAPEVNEGCPIGCGYTKETGWFVIGSGQGPFLIFKEKSD